MPKLAPLALVSLLAFAPAQTTPKGWTSEARPLPRGGQATVFTPSDLATGEKLEALCFPLTAQGGKVLLEFLDTFADEDAKALGKPFGKPTQATGSTPNAASTSRVVTTSDGKITALYIGATMDRQNARVMRVTFAGNGEILKRYGKGIAALNTSLVEAEKKEAVRSGRGLDLEKVPTAPPGFKPGGKLVPGIYAGNMLDDAGAIHVRYRVYLYETKEYRFCDVAGADLKDATGEYDYDPTTGKLQVQFSRGFYNNAREPDDEKCLFGRDKNGKACIYTYDDRGIGHHEGRFWLVGPIDRPSPKEEKELARKIDEEKRRYKFVVEPGAGLQPDQIAGIFHDVQFTFDPIQGNHGIDSVYLLLADGTLRDGLPVAPEVLDVSLSKRREPEVWGTWKRVGNEVHAAWRDAPDRFAKLPGTWAVPADQKAPPLGMFQTSMTTGNAITGSGFHFWGVTFTDGNRFEKFSRGGYSNSTLAQTLNDTYIYSSYDDEGAVTGADTPGVFVSTKTKKKKGGDKRGTFTIEGWSLVQQREDGTTTRTPFFFTNETRTAIYFEGSSMGKK